MSEKTIWLSIAAVIIAGPLGLLVPIGAYLFGEVIEQKAKEYRKLDQENEVKVSYPDKIVKK